MSDNLDAMARAIFQKALDTDRAGELLEALFNGAGVTLDVSTGELVILPAEMIDQALEDSD